MEEGEAEPGEMPSLKRPNPITWQTPPKKPRIADASDESPAGSADVRQDRQAGSASASRAASSKQPQPSPAKGVSNVCVVAWSLNLLLQKGVEHVETARL